jgi:CheY-like chemotaxis protein
VGIPPEKQDQIFEMFAQVSPRIDDESPGLGIGLTLVRTIVEMHGGSISVKSEGHGRGCTFLVRLPSASAGTAEASPDDSTSRQDAALSPPAADRSQRVLVVDDNEDAARMLGMVIGLMGHEVRTAADGSEGCQVADEFRPHVIFMDIGMPRMNGHEAARYIRSQAWGREICLVALTGWGQPDDKDVAAQAGFDHHLTKPADLDDVQKILSEIVVT